MSSSNGGVLILGGISNSYYTGTIYYTPISTQTYWKFQLTGILIDNNVFAKNTYAIADTGTTLIIGPYGAISSINNYIGATQHSSTTWILSSCSLRASMPSIHLLTSLSWGCSQIIFKFIFNI